MKSGLKRGLAGIEGDVIACRDGQAVAVPCHQVAEVVHGEQPGIYLYLLQTGIDEGSGIAGGLIAADTYRFVHGRIAGAFGKPHRHLVSDGTDKVVQACIGTYHTLESLLYYIKVRLFEIFAEEVRRDLDCEGGIYQGNRPDFLEPGLEMLGFDYLRDYLQTVVPTV